MSSGLSLSDYTVPVMILPAGSLVSLCLCGVGECYLLMNSSHLSELRYLRICWWAMESEGDLRCGHVAFHSVVVLFWQAR